MMGISTLINKYLCGGRRGSTIQNYIVSQDGDESEGERGGWGDVDLVLPTSHGWRGPGILTDCEQQDSGKERDCQHRPG